MTKRQYEQHEKPAFYSESTTKNRWALNSEEGSIIKAIIQSGHPLTWKELQEATGLEQESLRKGLCGLFTSPNEFHKNYSDARKQYVYEISEKLFEAYPEFHDLKKRFLKWIEQWKEVKDLDFSLEHEHFFLEGRHLDDFSKELISHAKTEVLIANPFIQDCDLSNTLREAKRNGITVQIITRPPKDNSPEYLKKKQEYHSILKSEKISLSYNNKMHAKIIVVDRAVAVVGSMNFYANSSAGVSWEAGLVSADTNVIRAIYSVFSNLLSNENMERQTLKNRLEKEP